MSHSRRNFIKTSAVLGAGYFVANTQTARASRMAIDKPRMACIGIGGKGESDTADAAKHGDLVAICDIDLERLDAAGKKYPQAKKFDDYRLMMALMGDKIDAVTVSTPDHSHAPAALLAMRMKKHCFCQKPLTHSIAEARMMRQVAIETGVATQMGNQGTAGDALRRSAAIIKSGALGVIKEVHVWTNRPIWPQGGEAPKPEPCPAHVKWDLWLGPAPYRPYAKDYHPFSWRGFWDFGTGALGDMACHTMNMPYMALDLKDPVSLYAQTSGHDGNYYPKWSIIEYKFPELNGRAPLSVFWYDGGKLPKDELFADFPNVEISASGSLTVGEKGKMYCPSDYAENEAMYANFTPPKVEFEKSPGHFEEWILAMQGGKPAKSNIQTYSAGLTETVLLGNLAVWADGKHVTWNPQTMEAKVESGLSSFVKPTYRAGYEL